MQEKLVQISSLRLEASTPSSQPNSIKLYKMVCCHLKEQREKRIQNPDSPPLKTFENIKKKKNEMLESLKLCGAWQDGLLSKW